MKKHLLWLLLIACRDPDVNEIRPAIGFPGGGAGGGGGAGDIEGVTAGTGITGGGTSGTVTVSLDQTFLNIRPTVAAEWVEHFLDDTIITSGNTGTGSASGAIVGEAGRPGIWRFNTGTTTTGMASGRATPIDFAVAPSSGLLVVEAVIRFVDALPDGTDSYAFRFGMGDSGTADFTDGVYVEANQTSANWIMNCAGTGTRTKTASSTALPASGTWVRVGATYDGTTATFFINGASIGTISNADCPAGAEAFGMMSNVIKSAGTNQRRVDHDYHYFRHDL